MRKIIYLLAMIVFISACNSKSQNKINNIQQKSAKDSLNEILDLQTFKVDTVFDDVTGEKYLKTNQVSFMDSSGNNGFKIYFNRTIVAAESQRSIYDYVGYPLTMYIKTISSDKCCDKGETMNLLFSNEKRVSLYNQQSFNCDNSQWYDFTNHDVNRTALDLMKQNLIKKIRILTYKSMIELSLSDKQAKLLLDVANEISKGWNIPKH